MGDLADFLGDGALRAGLFRLGGENLRLGGGDLLRGETDLRLGDFDLLRGDFDLRGDLEWRGRGDLDLRGDRDLPLVRDGELRPCLNEKDVAELQLGRLKLNQIKSDYTKYISPRI